ncbi:uncharacterized protein LOC127250930 [Andrographis paniculata]|uniref:uncharacterized protein LOC127250930 n=1 Tax=Andrographis paniculata TaxID=175694 RepID=UPI0021E79350|nr:uncharacterized protein LOC127250930 [Andrographis paniculata]
MAAAESNSASMVPVNDGATAIRAERMNSPSMVGRNGGDTAVNTERLNLARRIDRVSPSEIAPEVVTIPPWATEIGEKKNHFRSDSSILSKKTGPAAGECDLFLNIKKL